MLNISSKLAKNRDFMTALAGRSTSRFGDEVALVALTLRLQAPAAAVLIPVSIAGGVGNGLLNVCVATLVMTRSDERVRGRVSAALGAVTNGAGIASLVAGGGLAAVLDPRQIFLLASALGAVVTAVTAVRVITRGPDRPARDISLGAELSRI